MKTDNGISTTFWILPAVKTFRGRERENNKRRQQPVQFKPTLRDSRVSCYHVSLLEDTSGWARLKHDNIKLLLLFLGPKHNYILC